MSRSFGATLLTTRAPIFTSPPEISSRPATMRRSVLLPQPEGPTRTQNSPSAIDTSTPCTTSVEPNVLRTALRVTAAMGSVYLGLGDRCGPLEEIEVAAFVGLLDMLGEDHAVAAFVFACRGLPGAFPLAHLGVGNLKIQNFPFHVELDEIAVLHERERAADERLGRHMQHAGAVARAAHARIGEADHVAHALLEQLLLDVQHAPFRHAGAAERPGVTQHETRGRVDD